MNSETSTQLHHFVATLSSVGWLAHAGEPSPSAIGRIVLL
jgi:hypothetical protein